MTLLGHRIVQDAIYREIRSLIHDRSHHIQYRIPIHDRILHKDYHTHKRQHGSRKGLRAVVQLYGPQVLVHELRVLVRVLLVLQLLRLRLVLRLQLVLHEQLELARDGLEQVHDALGLAHGGLVGHDGNLSRPIQDGRIHEVRNMHDEEHTLFLVQKHSGNPWHSPKVS